MRGVPDHGHELRFGVFIPPEAERPDGVVALATLADGAGLDLVSFQDHPYQPRFLDTWTLLAFVAARTTTVRLAPNVVNLPLRPAAVLAKGVASLDRLSSGRVELGLGAGAFWDGVAAMGGPKLRPGESVQALSEAIDVIRALWDEDRRSARVPGTHHAVRGARTGPFPAHPVELWIGAYKPRMLRLTGEKGDGWLPSTGYLDLADLPRMNAVIDAAAERAGRRPEAVRRLLNVSGSFGQGSGFLEGPPAEWARQLAELALVHGTSTFVLAVSSASDLQRFAEEVAPAVRELVSAGRGATASGPPGPRTEATAAGNPRSARFAVAPTPDDGGRLSPEVVWDEATRPAGPAPDPDRRYTPDEQAAGRHLVDVHDALRAELTQLRDLVEQVARGRATPQRVRSFITRMTIRQHHWTLGTFCQTYCRVVTHHHTLEDRSVFPHLRRGDPELAAVLDRLEAEHETIADLLERVDRALVALVAAGDEPALDGVQATVDLLTDALLSHFAYEERELVEPLARLGFY
jgi:alkanesulfonate monooxygenase SsuD/methylene tetrahydromethanopterin reductase-like flavin-dependent oxidoreductase (luciferase family)/hemerythrin-like domain-containing protein